jgi:hypothetical protein
VALRGDECDDLLLVLLSFKEVKKALVREEIYGPAKAALQAGQEAALGCHFSKRYRSYWHLWLSFDILTIPGKLQYRRREPLKLK